MAVKVAINGFGRIGRLVFRALTEQGLIGNEIDVVAVGDIVPTDNLAYLLKYDSTQGRFNGTVSSKKSDPSKAEDDVLVVNGREIKLVSARSPKDLPWKAMGVDLVIESTGLFTEGTREANEVDKSAFGHIVAGAKKVIISAPAKNEDITVVMGVNGKIFVGQGKAIGSHAASDVRILVVGNPCNTNCLVARSQAKEIPDERWTALTRLDHNRARSALAKKAGVSVPDVTRMTIWGNHSNTQYPDFTNALIGGKPAPMVITDRAWLENDFVPQVQQRGAAVIKARGSSSALSAANGALDHVKSQLNPTANGDWVSMAVVSKGQYGVPKGLVFGYPCKTLPGSQYEVVEGLSLDAYGQQKLKATLDELLEEKAAVQDLLS